MLDTFSFFLWFILWKMAENFDFHQNLFLGVKINVPPPLLPLIAVPRWKTNHQIN